MDKAKFTASNNSVICSNHFEYGKPTSGSPYPKLFLTESDNANQKSPHQRPAPKRNSKISTNIDKTVTKEMPENDDDDYYDNDINEICTDNKGSRREKVYRSC